MTSIRRYISNIDLTEWTIKLTILLFQVDDCRYAGEQSDDASKLQR